MIDKFLMSRTPDAQPQCEQKIKRERARQQGESARMGKSILVNENDIYRHIDAIIIFYAVGKETIERRIDNDIGISLSNCFVLYFFLACCGCCHLAGVFTFNFLLSRSIIGLWFHCYCYLFVVTHRHTGTHNGIRVQQIYRSANLCAFDNKTKKSKQISHRFACHPFHNVHKVTITTNSYIASWALVFHFVYYTLSDAFFRFIHLLFNFCFTFFLLARARTLAYLLAYSSCLIWKIAVALAEKDERAKRAYTTE